MLRIDNLSKSFSVAGQKRDVLKSISFSIPQGQVVGLIGENGAGKTTLIKCTCGLITPSGGDIVYNGISILKNRSIVQDHFGVVLEGNRNLYHFLSVKDNIKYFGYLNYMSESDSYRISNQLIDKFNMLEFINQPVNELSRGTQQKIALIVCLMKDPNVLIFDEPTLGLDLLSSISIKKMIESLSSLGKIVVIVSHDLNMISEICDRVICLENGKITFDKSTDSLKNSHNRYRISFIDRKRYENVFKFDYEFRTDGEIAEIVTDEMQDVLKLIDSEDILVIEKDTFRLEKYLLEGDVYDQN